MSRTNNSLRERLAQSRDQLRVLRDERSQAKRNAASAREAFKAVNESTRSGSVESWPEFRAVAAADARVNDLDRQIDLARQAEVDLLQLLAGNSFAPSYSFASDPDVVEMLGRVAGSSTPVGSLPMGQYMSAEEVASLIGGAVKGDVGFRSKLQAAGFTDTAAPNMSVGTPQGIIPQLRQALTFLDFFPSRTVGEGRSHDYVVESGTFDGATETAPGAVKPELTAVYTDAEAVYRTIAGWLKVNKQTLADVPELEARLRSRGVFSVMKRLEAQIINGDGVGQNIRGILQTTGIGVQPYVAGPIADQLIRGASVVLASGAQPNVAAVSLTDLVTMFVTKTTGGGDYLYASAIALLRELGITLVPALGLAAGTAVVADTQLAGRVIVREGVGVTISDNDQDDFVRNRVTLLAEGRFGLEVEQPAAVCSVDLTA